MDEALRPDVLLAYEVNGQPLPPQHGFPLRLIVPGWYGMTHVKWLERITVLTEPFEGYQQAKQYRTKQSEDELGDPVTRMLPRSLLIPPGIPDFPDRQRFLAPGPCTLEGRAWSGHGPVTRVEVSVDGGQSWADATLDEPTGEFGWRRWTYEWNDVEPGDYELCSRATDAAGNVQPHRRELELRRLREQRRAARPSHRPRLTAPEDSAQEAGLLAFDLEAGRWLLERPHPRQLFRRHPQSDFASVISARARKARSGDAPGAPWSRRAR